MPRSTRSRRGRRRPPRERAEILRRAFDLLQERKEDFALLMTIEMGKPLAEARGEVAYGGEFLRWFSEETARIQGRYGVEPRGHRPHDRVAASGRPVLPHHAVELPAGDGDPQDRARARRRLHRRDQAGRAHAADDARTSRKLLEDAGLPEGRRQRLHHLDVGRGLGADHPRPAAAQAVVHRLDPGRRSGCSSRRRRACCAPRWSSAATPRSSCSTTPTSTRRSTARCSRSSATSARRARPPTGSSCTARSPTSSPAASPSGCRAMKIGRGTEDGVIDRPAHRRPRGREGRRAGRGRRRPRRAACSTGGSRDRRARHVLRADRGHRRAAGQRHPPRGDLRPGARDHPVRHRGRRRAARERHRVRAGLLRLHREPRRAGSG